MRKKSHDLNRNRKLWLIAFCVCLTALIGCHPKEQLKKEEELPEYSESSLVFRLPAEHCPFTLMGSSDTHFYYYYREPTDDTIFFYRQTLEKESQPVRLKLPSEPLFFRSFCIFTDSEGNDSIYLLLLNQETTEISRFSLVGYDAEGTLLTKLALPETGLPEDYPDAFLRLSDGGFAIITKKSFFVTDDKGQALFSLPCPGAEFRGLAEISDKKIGVTYAEADADNARLAIVDLDAKTMSGGTAITGDGRRLCPNRETLAYVDESGICLYDPTTGTISKAVTLKGRNMELHQLAAMRALGDSFCLLGYSGDATAAKYIIYSPKQETSAPEEWEAFSDGETYDAYGRRYIYLYDYSGDWLRDSSDPIDAFNEQSDSYQVVFKDYGYDHAYDDTYDTAKIVASGDYPDLIYSTYNSLIAALSEKGALEDLTPYINSSGKLSLEDLSEPIVAAYTDRGRLFALPNYYALDALWGDRAQLGEAGWTVDGFLDWMAQEPNAGAPLLGTRREIYNACIPAVLEMCIDRETGEASFDGEVFHSFITKLKALNRKDVYTREEALQALEDMEESVYRLQTGVSLHTIAKEEYASGRKLVIKGYPSADGKPVAYITTPALSILSTSEVKEGAYEFLEFYLLYQSDAMVRLKQEGSSFYGIWTVNRYREQHEAGIEASSIYPCSKEQLEEVTNIIPYAVLKDNSQDSLIHLIYEELEPYFENQKDGDTVCGIIQSRIQLYLQEQGEK
ncbi:MAG: ABC transporter substrate-binding protein [Roseburia sp.]|nr:ABC transporter substrate-binding protein [Roseburia sp.]